MALAPPSAGVGGRPRRTCLQFPNGTALPSAEAQLCSSLWAGHWRGALTCLPRQAPGCPEGVHPCSAKPARDLMDFSSCASAEGTLFVLNCFCLCHLRGGSLCPCQPCSLALDCGWEDGDPLVGLELGTVEKKS